MKYCSKCGTQVADEAVACPNCGNPMGVSAPVTVSNDSSSFGFALLGFCIPIVGLILWLVWKDSSPLKAKSAGKGALISVILSVVIWIIYAIFVAVFLSSSMMYY